MARQLPTIGGNSSMRRVSSAVAITNKILEQRARMGSSFHIFVILTMVVLTLALSAFFMPPHQHIHLRASYMQRQTESSDLLTQSTTAAHAAAAKAAAAQAIAVANTLPPTPSTCHAQPGAEYAGDVVLWGEDHLQDNAAACCNACQAVEDKGCNVWVWCGNPTGCGERKHKECWLKQQQDMRLIHIAGARETNFTSGAFYDESEYSKASDAEKHRLAALRNDESLPLVYLDVAIKGKPIGRMHFVLFTKDSPRAAENFRQLCTGEKGVVPEGHTGAGLQYHLRDKPFYRIIHGFIDQAGAETDSVFGGQFKDDAGGLKLKHDRKGLLSMANIGPDTNDSHFSIMVEAAPHLDGHYTIFGEAVDGFEVIDAINALAKGKPDHTATAEDGAMIIGSGQIRKGSHIPDLGQRK